MQYAAWIAYDDGEKRDCRVVRSNNIQDFKDAAFATAEQLLCDYGSPKFFDDNGAPKKSPLDKLEGNVSDRTDHALTKLNEYYVSATAGDMYWPLSPPLDKFYIEIEVRKD